MLHFASNQPVGLRTFRLLLRLASLLILLAAPTLQDTSFAQSKTEQATKVSESPLSSASYGGHVFLDMNGNGVVEMSEDGIEGILIQIESLSGEVIAQAYSNEEGYYMFHGLPEMTVRVRVKPPRAYRITAYGDYTVALAEPRATVIVSTGIFIGVYCPFVTMQ